MTPVPGYALVLFALAGCGTAARPATLDPGASFDAGHSDGAPVVDAPSGADRAGAEVSLSCAPDDLTGLAGVRSEFVRTAPPSAPRGGVIYPGRYVLTRITYYVGDAGISAPSTPVTYTGSREFAAGEGRITEHATNSHDYYAFGPIAAESARVTFTPRCSSDPLLPSMEDFTATDASFTAFGLSSYTVVREYTRR